MVGAYYDENREKCKASAKAYYLKNRVKYIDYYKNYYILNKDRISEQHKEYRRARGYERKERKKATRPVGRPRKEKPLPVDISTVTLDKPIERKVVKSIIEIQRGEVVVSFD